VALSFENLKFGVVFLVNLLVKGELVETNLLNKDACSYSIYYLVAHYTSSDECKCRWTRRSTI